MRRGEVGNEATGQRKLLEAHSNRTQPTLISRRLAPRPACQRRNDCNGKHHQTLPEVTGAFTLNDLLRDSLHREVDAYAMDTPLLWHIPLSHYSEKVRWALDYKGIPHRRQVLGP